MASLVPWSEFEEEYAQNFSPEIGAPALPFRVALGSLIIKEKLGISDRETVEQIKENPYLQYFIGQKHYNNEAPYDPSLLARFRERINVNLVNRINERMVIHSQSENEDEPKKKARKRHRIVNLSQPHIRPIVRGKAGVPVEFGAKISASVRDGYVFLDRISWDNFNEAGDLKAQIEAYYNYTGVYPESVYVDKIYRSRANRAFCKEKGIRISGPPLGRPKANVSQELKKQAHA